MANRGRPQRLVWSINVIATLLLMAAPPIVLGLVLSRNGLSARQPLSRFERRILQSLRTAVISAAAEDRPNPLAGQPDAWRAAVHHYEAHCALCHGEDGRGTGELGKKLEPAASDLTDAAVQRRTDSELYHVIANGIRMTGMPAFGDEDSPEEIWALVAFIRHLPAIAPQEREQGMNAEPRALPTSAPLP